MNLVQYDEMDTFYLHVEDAVIEAAIAPLSDFTFTFNEMVEADYIKPWALRGTLRTYRYTIREILISKIIYAPVGIDWVGRFIEIFFNCPLNEGWPETMSEIFKLNNITEGILAGMISNYAAVTTHNWKKEGF